MRTLCLLALLAAPAFGAWTAHTVEAGPSGDNGPDGTNLIDVDGDGDLEIASAWEHSNLIRAYLNTGMEPWPAVTVGAVNNAEDATWIDLDGDMQLDVLTARQFSMKVSVHWGPAQADFLNASAWTTANFAAPAKEWVIVKGAQLDRQQGPDVLVGARSNGGVYWLEAPADPRIAGAWQSHLVATADEVMGLEAIDMDGDGDLDALYSDQKVVAWRENPGYPSILTVNSWTKRQLGTQNKSRGIDYADLDADGLVDVVVGSRDGTNTAYFYRRLAASGLSWTKTPIRPVVATGIGITAKDVAVGDLDGDGNREVVVTRGGDGCYCVYSLSYVTAPTDLLWTATPISALQRHAKFDSVQLRDMDADTDLDVVSSDEEGHAGVVWFENTP